MQIRHNADKQRSDRPLVANKDREKWVPELAKRRPLDGYEKVDELLT